MNTIHIDIETNGLPETITPNEYYDPTDYDNLKYYHSSRIIKIVYTIHYANKKLVKSFSSFVRSKYIKNEKCMKLSEIFSRLIDDIDDCHTIVAHNIKFVMNMMLSEIYRDMHNTNDTINEQNLLQFAAKLKKKKKIGTNAADTTE